VATNHLLTAFLLIMLHARVFIWGIYGNARKKVSPEKRSYFYYFGTEGVLQRTPYAPAPLPLQWILNNVWSPNST
jgi:hypothetical protein